MLRFAPDLTDDMYLKDLRIAIFNYILSKQTNKNLIIYIKDLKQQNNINDKDAKTIGLLELFGITYKDVLYQSKNLKFYSAMAIDLLHKKKAFNCFCTDETLKKQKRYNGACENLPAEFVIDNTNPFGVRIKKPSKSIHFKDIIKGEIKINPKDIDSLMILQKDKTPTRNFAHAIDDMLNDISLIIEKDSFLYDTARQIHIRKSLGYEKDIDYAHIPTLLDDDTSVTQLLKDGYLPQAIANYLITTCTKTPKEIFDIDEAIKWFDLSSIYDKPTKFDIQLLREINKKHLFRLSSKELSNYVGFADEDIGNLAKLYLDEAKTTKELKSIIKAYFEPKNTLLYDDTKKLKEIIKQAPFFEKYDDFLNHLAKESGLSTKTIPHLLVVIFSGKQTTPDISQIYNCIKNYLLEIVK